MLKSNVEYQVTVTFRDTYGNADETDPEFAIQKALEDIDIDVIDVSYPKEVSETSASTKCRLTR
jgi:hypothetical protein